MDTGVEESGKNAADMVESGKVFDEENFPTIGVDGRDWRLHEIKKEIRREWHFFLWGRQKTYKEIQEITGFSKVTIWNDLKEVEAELAANPIDHEKTRQLTLLQMRQLAAEITHRARTAENDNSAAKLYKEAADIHKTILNRFTQPVSVAEVEKTEKGMSSALMDFMIEKFGPEALDDFEKWYSKRKIAQDALKG